MSKLFEVILTPAIISLLVSTWVGRVLEARRAQRDHITKLFEHAREDVRRSVEAAVDYFATIPSERAALQEAKVVASDRELRAGLGTMLAGADKDHCELELAAANSALQELVAELTAGNFQGRDGEVDRAHILKIVHAGANLRSSLARLRDRQLAAAAEHDPIMRFGSAALDYMKSNNPFRERP